MDTSTIEPQSVLVCFPLVHDSWLQLLLQLFHACYSFARKIFVFPLSTVPGSENDLFTFKHGYESKPWYPSEPQITGKWMFIPPNIARLVLIHPHIRVIRDPVPSWALPCRASTWCSIDWAPACNCSAWSLNCDAWDSSAPVRRFGDGIVIIPGEAHNWEFFQWPFQDPRLEVPTIYKAYVRPM